MRAEGIIGGLDKAHHHALFIRRTEIDGVTPDRRITWFRQDVPVRR